MPRTDLLTASRVDLTLVLIPTITWLEASCMLARSGVPADVAARVLALPGARRTPREFHLELRGVTLPGRGVD